ncbi:MAG TPA: prepilin-type N-terminal cleavage/methylation domain-containing protein [Candidatus Methylomirabilis sp.]|nr:prepilin-type N-terminal cleavage/methylation domain-containing protein [Candidatus Methylomirabilis sp.]HSC70617.1 prepilin-type N-terminal cleavage/methylation domain-containing protein [Candidatus Methylomirabilis sp.]
MSEQRRAPSAERGGTRRAEGGFTLLEVVVAIALVGLGLAAALELLAVGLRSAKTSGDYTEAVLLAKRKLGELIVQVPTARVVDGTVGEAYRWTGEVAPERQDTESLPVRLFKFRVRVSWAGKGGEKGVELVTLRGVEVENPPPGGPGAPAPASASPGAQRGVMR